MAGQVATNQSSTLAYAPPHIKSPLARAIRGASLQAFRGAVATNVAAGDWERNTANYAKSFLPDIDNINNFFGGVSQDIAGVETSVNTFYADALNSVRKQTGTFSEDAGAVITDLSGIVRNPLDFQNVSNRIASIMNRIGGPGSSNALNQTIKNLHLDKLAKAPGILFNSIQKLANAIDNLLAIPIAFISSVYYGVIGLIKQVGTLLNNLLNGFQKFLLDFLDEIIPLKEILQLLNDIGTLAGQIQGLATAFGGGPNIVAGFALQINTFTNQINSALASPLQTVFSFLPSDIQIGVSQIMNNLQNPEQFLSQIIPQDLQNIFGQIASITGFGVNGNMAFGFGELLDKLRPGVINSILSNYAAQYNILAPLLGGGINGGGYKPPISYTPTTDNGYIQGKKYLFNPQTKVYEVQ